MIKQAKAARDSFPFDMLTSWVKLLSKPRPVYLKHLTSCVLGLLRSILILFWIRSMNCDLHLSNSVNIRLTAYVSKLLVSYWNVSLRNLPVCKTFPALKSASGQIWVSSTKFPEMCRSTKNSCFGIVQCFWWICSDSFRLHVKCGRSRFPLVGKQIGPAPKLASLAEPMLMLSG